MMKRSEYHAKLRQSAGVFLFLVFLTVSASAQENTVGLIEHMPGAYEGYTLFAPIRNIETYLVDMEGRLVNSWPGQTTPGLGVYLLSDGRLLRSERLNNLSFTVGGGGGRIVIRSWEGDVEWEYRYSDDWVHQHHDLEMLPNGNILMIAWERKTPDEAIAAGIDTSRAPEDGLYPDHIIEVRPEGTSGGTIVWEWHVWDHLIQDVDSTKSNYGVVEEHPELINLNAEITGTAIDKPDWWHSNAVDYNEELDQIVISVRNYSEIWIIDHSTTTEEAAGHSGGRYGRGGDLLYRYGNPRMYQPDAPVLRKLVVQHDARWIPEGYPGEGNITVFNNGDRNLGAYSSIVEITPPMDSSGYYHLDASGIYGPETPVWSYTAPNPQDFFAKNISGASRLPNGNTLICNGPYGEFIEVTPEGETVWRYVNPVTHDGPLTQGTPVPGEALSKHNSVFRCTRIAPDDPRLAGKDLTPGDPIELYPASVRENDHATAGGFALDQNYPNPFNTLTRISFELPSNAHLTLTVRDQLGRIVAVLTDAEYSAGMHIKTFDGAGLPGGVYTIELRSESVMLTRRMLLAK